MIPNLCKKYWFAKKILSIKSTLYNGENVKQSTLDNYNLNKMAFKFLWSSIKKGRKNELTDIQWKN